MNTMTKHPLQDLILRAFADEGDAKYQDRVKLVRTIAGSHVVTGSAVLDGTRIRAQDAYKVVVDDVLSVMKENGLVVRDRQGWYTLTDLGRAERDNCTRPLNEKIVTLPDGGQMRLETFPDRVDVSHRMPNPSQPEFPWTPWIQVHEVKPSPLAEKVEALERRLGELEALRAPPEPTPG